MRSAVRAPKPIIRPSVETDCAELAFHLRREDLLEIFHASGKDPLQAIQQGFAISQETVTVTLGGRVVLMTGIVGVAGYAGSPWMLATDDLAKIRKTFLRDGERLRDRWLAQYKYLENKVWTRNITHVQWLRWMGFTFAAPEIYGVTGELFQRFYMKEK
jgi:hypothetical protein